LTFHLTRDRASDPIGRSVNHHQDVRIQVFDVFARIGMSYHFGNKEIRH